MKQIFLILIISITSFIRAQNIITLRVKDKNTNELLIGVNCVLKGTDIGWSSDFNGKIIIDKIPNGKQILVFSYVGYKTVEKAFDFPMKENKPITVFLEEDNTLNTVTIYSTRTDNRIEEIPTRIEVIGNEEVVEETAINPGNISKLLGETSGVQVQHTSAISGNVSFSIQGLPGKYTQLLQDGLPLYGGFSSGLSLLQIPPLNLQQVEIIKGSNSTLYGSDAIAGVVNLITKKPTEKPEFSVLLNQTSKGGNDFSSFYRARKNKLGITLLASVNKQQAKDVSKNGFTDIPKYNRFLINPKIFYYINKKSHLSLEISNVNENRIGGDLLAIKYHANSNHSFFEEDNTNRFNANIRFKNVSRSGNILTFKIASGSFDRSLRTNVNLFKGIQNTIYSELSYFVKAKKHNWVSGLNFYGDRFRQKNITNNSLSYSHQTLGIFTQDNWRITKSFYFEPGIRLDYNYQYGSFLLPRVAIMYHFSDKFFTRLNGGLGYRLPTPFTDEAERTRYQHIIMPSNLKIEKSSSANLDFNFKTTLSDDLLLTANQEFFITNISNPILADQNLLKSNIVDFKNYQGSILSKGINTNIKLTLDELNLYIDYTMLNAKKTFNNNRLEFIPQNKLITTLSYEDEDSGLKTGLEAFYFGNQYIDNTKKAPNYWLLGASVQKEFNHITVALNVENILDIRQTRYENIVSGPINNPNFSELYASLDGRVENIVLKYDLY